MRYMYRVDRCLNQCDSTHNYYSPFHSIPRRYYKLSFTMTLNWTQWVQGGNCQKIVLAPIHPQFANQNRSE